MNDLSSNKYVLETLSLDLKLDDYIKASQRMRLKCAAPADVNLQGSVSNQRVLTFIVFFRYNQPQMRSWSFSQAVSMQSVTLMTEWCRRSYSMLLLF